MSEALTPPTTNSGASLYPADGGAAAAAALQAATQTAAVAGTDTVAGVAGADTLTSGTGTDTVAGTDTTTGTDTTVGTGTDTVAGAAGTDTISGEAYTFTLPEGFTDNAELTAEAKTILAAAGVAPDKAQPLIDLFGKAVKASADAQATAFNTQQTAWINEINAMPEFQGPTRETSLQAIGRLWDEYGTPEAKAAFDGPAKIGNNPALAKMMLNIANVLTEGAPTTGGRQIGPKANQPKGQAQTVGQSLYPDAT